MYNIRIYTNTIVSVYCSRLCSSLQLAKNWRVGWVGLYAAAKLPVSVTWYCYSASA